LEVNVKKTFSGIIPLIIVIMGCAGGAKPAASPVENSTANSGSITLDQALKEAAGRIDERIVAGSKIAPLNFNSPHDKFSSYVLDELTANLVDSRKLTVVDRKEVDLIRSEFDFQFSGEVGDDSMQELGRMLGAQSIISGSLTDMGGFHRIVIRVLNVQNASVEVQYRANIVSDNIVAALLSGGKSSEMVVSPRRASSGGTAPVVQTVQISDQVPPQPQRQISENDLVGVWKGSYGQGDGETALILSVFEEDGNYMAIFDFYNLPGKSNEIGRAHV
jgi:TolB-like protein